MEILGIGIDIEEIVRIRLVFSDEKDVYSRVFTKDERKILEKKNDPYPSMAGKYSAKEAVLKSLHVHPDSGLLLNSIEILNDTNGEPYCLLHGKARERMLELGGSRILLSISHTKNYSTAVAITSSE